LNQQTTTKLFYDQYAFKVTIVNRLAPIFRNKNWKLSRDVLDKLQIDYENGLPLTIGRWTKKEPVSENDFIDAKNLFKKFVRNENKFGLRIQYLEINVYSNEKKWLKKLLKGLHFKDYVFFSPPEEYLQFLIDNKNTIIVSPNFEYGYKITFGNNVSTTLADFLVANRLRFKYADTLIKDIQSNISVKGRYIYCKTDKDIMLLRIATGNNVSRIDRCVKQTIDK